MILEYEHSLTRIDSRTEQPYDVSSHFVWVGERTRQLDGAHVELLSKIANPIGVKLGPTSTADDAIALYEKLNPERVPGKITFITRFGADKIRDGLPNLVEKVTAAGLEVAWVCDPMHGNTFETLQRLQDARVRRRHRRGARLLRGAPQPRHLARRRPRRAHG